MITPRARILPPYTRRIDDVPHRLRRIVLIAGLTLLAMVMGLMIAILPPNMIAIPAAPALLLMGLALWMTPTQEAHLDGAIRRFFFLFMTISFVWPDYVAFAMPGLGGASFTRMAMGLLFFTSLYALSTSVRMREEVKDVLTAFRPLLFCFLAFVCIQALMAFGTGNVTSRWFYTNIFWYYLFIIAAWLFCKEGVPRRFIQILLICIAIQGLYSFWESANSAPLWAGRIPPLMSVDPSVQHVLESRLARGGSDSPRVKSIYLTPLTYAEFMALVLPFCLYAIAFGRKTFWRLSAIGLFVFMFANIYMTDSRSGMVGLVIGLLGFTGLWSIRRFWRYRKKRDLVGPAFVWSYPAVAIAALAAVLVVPPLRVAVLGGSQHVHSNNARDMQWDNALRVLAKNPIGHGPDSAGWTAGTRGTGGQITVDSYPINLLMDYGILGFTFYTLFFFIVTGLAIRTFWLSDDSEETLAGPVAVAMVSFLFIKTVLSQQENHYLAFALAGMALALYWRQEQRLKAEAAARTRAQEARRERPWRAGSGSRPGRAAGIVTGAIRH
ncbi:MAG: O-antigen ligase family protein [Sphingomonadaceae bacterium]